MWIGGGSYLGSGKVVMGLRCGFEINAPCSNPTKSLARPSYIGHCERLLWRGLCMDQRDWPTEFLLPKYEESFQLGGKIYLSCYSFGTFVHILLWKLLLLSLCKNNVMYHWILTLNSSGISSQILFQWHKFGRIYFHESTGLSGSVRYQWSRNS